LDNDLESSRKVEHQMAKFVNRSLSVPCEQVHEKTIRGVLLGEEYSLESTEPIILYFHGGGYSLCDELTYGASLAELISIFKKKYSTAIRIFSLSYTLAPEAQYPTQQQEGIAALKYLKERFPSRPLYLMGDSAGGHLVLSVLAALRESDAQLLKGIEGAILISPWVNFRVPTPNYEKFVKSDYVTNTQLRGHHERFLTSESSMTDPRVNPAVLDSLEGFPKLFIHYGSGELFSLDIEEFYNRFINDKKASLTVIKVENAPHITPMLLPFFPQFARFGLESICEFVSENSKLKAQ
jgi:acetyl esterase/lipase